MRAFLKETSVRATPALTLATTYPNRTVGKGDAAQGTNPARRPPVGRRKVLVTFFGSGTDAWLFREDLLPYEKHAQAKTGKVWDQRGGGLACTAVGQYVPNVALRLGRIRQWQLAFSTALSEIAFLTNVSQHLFAEGPSYKLLAHYAQDCEKPHLWAHCVRIPAAPRACPQTRCAV